jgi:fluoride ion exporter CrcB/FEX
LVQDGDWRRAALYVCLSVVGSLVGITLGILGARELLDFRQAL